MQSTKFMNFGERLIYYRSANATAVDVKYCHSRTLIYGFTHTAAI